MSLAKQKCNVCEEMCDVVMNSSQSRYLKVCLDCYNKIDKKNPIDFGGLKNRRNYGTHSPK